MDALPLILLVAGCAAFLYVVRCIQQARTTSFRGRARYPRIEWEFTYKLLPIPQCAVQLDDPDSLAWITGHLSHTDPGLDGAVLPLIRSAVRIDRHRSGQTAKPGIAAALRCYSYYYLSPAVAVIGSALAVTLLFYQAGWTVNAIVTQVRQVGQVDLPGSATSTMLMGRSIRRRRMHTKGLRSALAIAKRGVGDSSILASTEPANPSDSGSVLQPLIPGITIPVSHTFSLLLALFLSQVIHELGHLAVAALHGIQPLRLVAGLWTVLPFAAVVLPSSINHTEPKALLRVAAAGPYHNFLTYLFLLSFPLLGMHNLFYEDVASLGVYVTHVGENSPLKGHLPENVVIAHLDDVPLGTAFHSAKVFAWSTDVWSTYLLSGDDATDEARLLQSWNEGRGWCVEESLFRDAAPPPCPPSTGIRFVRVDVIERGQEETPVKIDDVHRCFSAYPLLTEPTVDCSVQCRSSDATADGRVCVRPAPEEGILRIRYGSAARVGATSESEQVVLFAGDRVGVHRDVHVTTWKPRGGAVLRSLVRWGELVIFYVATLSFALATLNLLPIPRLDGTHILSAVLSLVIQAAPQDELEEHDMEEMEEFEGTLGGVSRNEVRRALVRKRRWHRAISWTTTGLAVVCIGGGLVLEAL